jgi:hypothetical protein
LGKIAVTQAIALGGVIDIVQEGERVEEGVGDAAICPVEIEGIVVLDGDVAGVQVAMYQRRRDGVMRQLLAQRLQVGREGAQLLDFTSSASRRQAAITARCSGCASSSCFSLSSPTHCACAGGCQCASRISSTAVIASRARSQSRRETAQILHDCSLYLHTGIER